MKSRFVLGVVFVFEWGLGFSQVLYPGSYLEDYYRLLDLKNENFSNRIMVSRSNVSVYGQDSTAFWNPWGSYYQVIGEGPLHLLPIMGSVNFNSKYPRGYNDGPVWKGKGVNADLTFGIRGNIGILHYTFAPTIYSSQNRDFYKPNRGINDTLYSYQFGRNIDWVQRYGSTSFNRLTWGQSDLRIIYKKMTIGISTQNTVWGPAQVNPILLGTNAEMFPHVDFGTDTPIKTPIGDIEFRLYWGLMQGSAYFRPDNNNNLRYFQGGSIQYAPSFIPGLSLGLNRVHYRDWDIQDFEGSELFLFFADFSSNQDSLGSRVVNDVYDGMVTIDLRWKFEEVGFEAYLELGRNDFSNFQSLRVEPEHSRAYTLGFTKLFEIDKERVIKAFYEHTVLGRAKLGLIRPGPIFYQHHLAIGGYTQKGQILGAGTGPGSQSDIGDIRFYYPKGYFGTSFQRIRFNDDYAFSQFTSSSDRPFDVEFTYSLMALRFLGKGLSLGVTVNYSDRFNWYYERGNNPDNLYLEFNFGYHPPFLK